MHLQTTAMLAEARDRAVIDASERVSPNSFEYDALVERLEETYSEPVYRYEELRREGHPHHAAMLMAGLADPPSYD